MTENLRKELAQDEVLTPATSDVLSDVTVGAATQPYNQASTNYYDWGIGTSGTLTEDNTDRWLSRSTKVGSTWSTETTPVQSGAPSANLTGEDQKTGVYYNWYTATAGTGTWSITTAGTEASSSVCPAGWQLPRYSAVDGTSTLAPSGSWMHLIRDVYKIITTQGNQGSSSTANAKLHAFPFSLPYSGNVEWQSGGTLNQGGNGYFWSAGATSRTDARYLAFFGTNVWPEGSHRRLYGFSVRCVADDSTPGTLTVSPDTIDADTATTVDVSIPLSGEYNANISLGSTALTCSRTSTSPLSFSCNVPSATSGTYTLTASLPSYGKNYTGTLTVNPSLSGMCSAASVGSTFTYSGVEYIKLDTASSSTGDVDGSACYTKTSRGRVTWDKATSVCPANTRVPTRAQFQSLIDTYGSDGTIYITTGWSGSYWSSTQYPNDISRAYRLGVSYSSASFGIIDKTNAYDVVCIVR